MSQAMGTAVLHRRPDRRAVWIALATTVAMNGALYALLALLHRAPPEALPEVPVVRRVERVPPPPPVMVQPAAAAPSAAAPQVAVAAPPLPALPGFTPQLALPAPVMPNVVAATVVALPPVTMAGGGGESGSGAGGTAAPANAAIGSDQAPFLVNGFDMERFYPRVARLRGIEGTTLLRIAIDDAGKVTACTVVTSDPPGVFDKEAENLGFSLKFLPARSHGVAVATIVQQQIAWKLPR